MSSLLRLSIALTLVACGVGPPPLPLEEQPREFAKAFCSTVIRCCGSSIMSMQDRLRWTGDPPSQAFCEEQVAAVSVPRIELAAASVKEGRAAYDAEGTRACIVALAAADCRAYRWFPGAEKTGCLVVTGLVPASRGCARDFECAGGGRCEGNGGTTCVVRGRVGETCYQDVDCPTHLGCRKGFCGGGTPFKSFGASCTDRFE